VALAQTLMLTPAPAPSRIWNIDSGTCL